jgi:hypothetical protein
MALPLDGGMVIDPLELFGDYHLTPTRGRIKTVNWNLKGAETRTKIPPIAWFEMP